jgi:hypothetical protein
VERGEGIGPGISATADRPPTGAGRLGVEVGEKRAGGWRLRERARRGRRRDRPGGWGRRRLVGGPGGGWAIVLAGNAQGARGGRGGKRERVA